MSAPDPAWGPLERLDAVELRGLAARGHHGVLPAERELGQVFVVDVVLHLDTRPAAATDDLAAAVSYAEVAQAVHAVVTGEPVDLLETLAARVAGAVLADLRVRAVDVAVHKPHAPVAVPFADVVVRTSRRNPAARAVLALGANTGDPARALVSAVAALDATDGITVTDSSPVYETDPVTDPAAPGSAPQPDYLNAVVAVRTALAPHALLAACRAVEAAHGRDRSAPGTRRWGPRPLDVDVLTVDGAALDDAELVLPHPRAAERAFVLVPWAAMAPYDVLLGHGLVGRLAAALAPSPRAAGVRLRPELALWPRTPRVGAP